MAKEKEQQVLVVTSKVKEAIKEMDPEFRMAGDLPEKLSERVQELLERAHERAVSNGRKTIKPEDI